MAEPTIDTETKTAIWAMQDDTNYILTGTELDDTTEKGFVISLNAMAKKDELDDNDFSNWADSSTITQDTTNLKFGVSTGRFDSSAEDISRFLLNNIFVIGGTIRESCWVKFDNVGTENTWVIWNSNPRPAFAIIWGFGKNSTVSSNNFAWYSTTAGAWQDTSILADNNWHHIALIQDDFGGECRAYIDGNLFSTTVSGNMRSFVCRTTDTGKGFNIDRVYHDDGNFYSNGKTMVTAPFWPNDNGTGIKVYSWKNFDYNSVTIGGYNGTISAVEFNVNVLQGATGHIWGTNYPNYNNGFWLPVTEQNLARMRTLGTGNDAIRFRFTFTRGTESTTTPLVQNCQVSYDDIPTTLKDCVVCDAELPEC